MIRAIRGRLLPTNSCLFVSIRVSSKQKRRPEFSGSAIALTSRTALMLRFDVSVTGMKGRYRAIRIFLVGVLCGVMIAAAVTFELTIPANSDYWRMEIWKRGGGAWTFDKNGHLGWEWRVEPMPDTPRKKPVFIPSSKTNVRTERL